MSAASRRPYDYPGYGLALFRFDIVTALANEDYAARVRQMVAWFGRSGRPGRAAGRRVLPKPAML